MKPNHNDYTPGGSGPQGWTPKLTSQETGEVVTESSWPWRKLPACPAGFRAGNAGASGNAGVDAGMAAWKAALRGGAGDHLKS